MYAADCYTDEVQCLCNRTECRCWMGTEGGLRAISVGLDQVILNGEEVQMLKALVDGEEIVCGVVATKVAVEIRKHMKGS